MAAMNRRACVLPASRLFALLAILPAAARADEPAGGEIALPPLRFDGVAARAHTQGLWIDGTTVLVTARLDHPPPRRALLLRAEIGGDAWDVRDITVHRLGDGSKVFLDHPGGFDGDGDRLWIPVAASRRDSRTLVCAYEVSKLEAPGPLQPAVSFVVEDHIGALAVNRKRRELYGASWDTRNVYIWGLDGTLRKKLSEAELVTLGLGVSESPVPRGGLAVQDWKGVGDRVLAAGVLKGPGRRRPRGRLFEIDLHDPAVQIRSVLPEPTGAPGVELGREGMAAAGAWIYFLPEDLDGENRLFRFRRGDLLERGARLPKKGE